MMTPTEREISAQLVRAKGWQWQDGMRGYIEGWDGDKPFRRCDASGYALRSVMPDLSDWPTLGALLGMMPLSSLTRGGRDRWLCLVDGHADATDWWYDTPGEATGRALQQFLQAP